MFNFKVPQNGKVESPGLKNVDLTVQSNSSRIHIFQPRALKFEYVNPYVAPKKLFYLQINFWRLSLLSLYSG